MPGKFPSLNCTKSKRFAPDIGKASLSLDQVLGHEVSFPQVAMTAASMPVTYIQ